MIGCQALDMLVTLIADDLTGACDAGALFAGRGPVGVFVAPASPDSEWNTAVVDTESRGLAPAAAANVVRAAARRLGPRLTAGLLFKKIDSTLRGPIGAELEALLEASGRRTALLCPSFPAQGRAVVEGTLLVNGTPAHASPIARDPAYPGSTSDVVDIVRRGTVRPVSFLPLDRVRGDGDALAQTIRDARDHVIVADALTDGDLDALAGATLGCSEVALAGSAGLARAVADVHGLAGAPSPLPRGQAWLIVAGSLHPATRAQIRHLEASGVTGVRLDGARDPDTGPLVERIKGGRPVFIATSDVVAVGPGARDAARSRLAALAARILADSRPDLIVVTGGETAMELLRIVGAARLELSGVPANGLALGDAVVDSTSRLPLLTKAGGFGPPELLISLLERTTP
jgi:uncharacterized protein YgbK (DUF1537 family)